MSIIPVRSVSEVMRSAHQWGGIHRSLLIRNTAAVTGGTTASGSMSGRRMDKTFTIPSLTGPSGVFCTHCRTTGMPGIALSIVGQETELGSLAMATNTFTVGSAMPVRRNGLGHSVQTISKLTALVATVAITGTTPSIGIDYTNEQGVSGRTATVVLPTSPVINSAFIIRPDQLQAGDLGIKSIQGMTKSAGTAGTLKAYGLNIITLEPSTSQASGGMISPVQLPQEKLEMHTGDEIAFYVMGLISATQLNVKFNLYGSD